MGNSKRVAQKDIWKGSMAKGAVFSPNDIPFCPTTSKDLPTDIITWTEAITIYNKEKRKNPAFFSHHTYHFMKMTINLMDLMEYGETMRNFYRLQSTLKE